MTQITLREKERILSALEASLDPKVFETWCRALEIEPLDSGAVRVPTANPVHRDWLDKLLRKPLEDAFQQVFGHVPEILFQVGGVPLPLPPAPATPRAPAPPPAVAPDAPPAPTPFVHNPIYTFENFIEGPSNRFALAAARAVSENPARQYNPLFIHGGVGLGKTHLLQAVCRAVLDRNPNAKVLYLSCEAFVNDYIYAIQKSKLETFRARHRSADLLVVDDIHFLADKEGSQEEFFHTFNTLHLASRQVILSSDQPAEDIRSLKQHLLSRFRSGLDVKISPPTFETRLAILRRKADARWKDVPQDVLGFIAQVVETNIRELEGALTKVMGYAALSNRAVELDLAREVLQDAPVAAPASLNISDVQHAVARYFNKKVTELQARRRTKSTSLARQVCIYLCRQLIPSASLQELGNHFGGKDHTTMLYSVKKIELLLPKNATLRSDIERLTRELRNRT
ncbi:MAG TPA: chromosomal replication initiator protein DnaA [Planctomycetota bacterium]